MTALLVILMATIGLSLRAGLYAHARRWNVSGVSKGEAGDETGLVETCARAFVLVLISLVGLMALGVMYGNVLGAVHAGP